jgi:methyl-accepting chemotaxis protein
MSRPELPSEFAPRLESYGLDDQVRRHLHEIRPLVEAGMPSLLDEFMRSAGRLPHVAAIYAKHRKAIRDLEEAHFRSLLRGNFDVEYHENCRQTVERSTEFGLEARSRMLGATVLLVHAAQALATRHRFSGRAVAERLSSVGRAVLFDIATCSTLALRARERLAETRRQAIDEAIGEFDGTIGDVIAAINESSGSLTAISSLTQKIATDTLDRMSRASSASGETTQSVALTVAATHELSASIREIGEQTARGLQMARAAVGDTERTQQTIRSLNEGAERIGSVVELISKIAAQTNLLALNATIEAARAGGMGKGFAVVAAEVKALANQTSRATDDIARQVAAIQLATKGAVDEIAAIAGKIDQLTEVASTIAAAVEQQVATTRDITASIQTAAGHTQHASTEIRSVEQAAQQGADAVHEISTFTERLSARARDLESRVARFFGRVRAA